MLRFFQNINWGLFWEVFRTVLVFIILYFIFARLLKILKKRLLKKAKTKKEKSNVEIFFRATQYFLILLLIIFAFLAYGGSLTGIGVVAGLLSAAFGWALQRPITGMAAWLMIVIKRPFEIGDRVIIGNIKGDVVDITLTHIHIKEIGGTIASEETSGRVILIPNAKLFEENIINYTYQGELILDQVKFTVTYESNLEKAQKIAQDSAKEVLSEYLLQPEQPYTRTWFQPSGVDVYVRYKALAQKREEISSKITKKIFDKVIPSREVEFAYPHQEVLLRKKEKIS